jgi:hypothetical protein
VPRPVVRPSAASDREPAGWPGYGDPLSSSCGRGSRVPWRDGASWAGRSASSSGLLESSPSDLGERPLRLPLEARKRAGTPRAHGASSSGG